MLTPPQVIPLVPAELRAAVPASDLPSSRRGAPCTSRSIGALGLWISPIWGRGRLAPRGAAHHSPGHPCGVVRRGRGCADVH